MVLFLFLVVFLVFLTFYLSWRFHNLLFSLKRVGEGFSCRFCERWDSHKFMYRPIFWISDSYLTQYKTVTAFFSKGE